MTQIEVPDWVASVALEVCGEHFTGSNDDMKRALTAALGAWVVPAFFATGGEGDFTLFTEFTDIDQAYAHAGDAGWVVEAYTLRQEKPE